MKSVICSLLMIAVFAANAQTVKVLTSGTKTSLRGLSAVNDNIIWVSGSGGMVGKSVDGGKNFKWTAVKGFEKTEFRDIEAFNETTAIIMAIDSPAYILRTTDGGDTWNKVYQNNTKGMFLDAMDFFDGQNGIVVGDPINNKFFLAETHDGGMSWKELPAKKLPVADSMEACFASSGTNIRLIKKSKYMLASGGLRSSFIQGKEKVTLPIIQGKESTGANSIAYKNKKIIIVVGGDFLKKDDGEKNCFISNDGGDTWLAPATAPHGYRSCIDYISGKTWITCGLNGVDITNDDGNNFKKISDAGFNSCRKAKSGNAVFFAGNNGKVAILEN